MHASDQETMFQSLVGALEKVYDFTHYMTKFVDGEQINTLWLKLISGEMCTWV